MIRIASPGPGNGCRHTIRSGRPSSSPTRRTSSLKSSRSGSTSSMRMSAGSPPTLWCDLITLGVLGAAGLDHVRVERPLHEEAHVAEPPRLLLEDADELLADDLPLLLRVVDAREPLEEPLLRLDVHERDVEVPVERLDDLLGLVLAQQPVVDEDARELVADRLVDEQRRDRGVDAAAQRAQRRARARPARGSARPAPRSPPPASTRAARRRRCRGSSSAPPSRAACARPRDGTARRTRARSGASNAAIGVDGEPATTRAPSGGATTESRCDIQTVCSAGQVVEELGLLDAQLGLAELGDAGAVDAAAEVQRQQLHAVADAERRNAELEERGSTRGAPSAYTDAGPPLRISACGLRARTCSGVTVCGTSSE